MTRQTPKSVLVYFTLVSSIVLSPLTGAAKSVDELAGALVKLRIEIDSLTEQIDSKKRQTRERQRAFESQKAQLEAELQREEMRKAQLTENKSRKTARIDAAKASEARLLPVFSSAAGVLERYIQSSIPFRRDDRLKEVYAIRKRLKDGLMTPGMALSRLWSIVEDEQRMSRDTGLFRDTVEVNGQPTMVDVIRIGNLGLYFRTGDHRVGRIIRRQSRWVTEFVIDGKAQEQVSSLFEMFKKQIRVGFFNLPSILPEEGR